MKIIQIIHATVLVAATNALPQTVPAGAPDQISARMVKRQGGDCDSSCSGHAYAIGVQSTWIIPWNPNAPPPMSQKLGEIGSHTFDKSKASQKDIFASATVCGDFSGGWSITCDGKGVPTGFSGPEGSGTCAPAEGDCVYEGGLSTLTYAFSACCDLS